MMEFTAKLSKDGRIVIPAICREKLQLSANDELVLLLEDDEIRLFSLEHAIQHAQRVVRKYNKSKKSLSGQLIKQRRKEAKDD